MEDGEEAAGISLDFENTDTVVTAETPTPTGLLANLAPAKGAAAVAPPPVTPTDVNDLKDLAAHRAVLRLEFRATGRGQARFKIGAGLYGQSRWLRRISGPVVTLSNALKVDLGLHGRQGSAAKGTERLEYGNRRKGLGDGTTLDPNADPNDNSDAANGFTADETEYNIFNTDKKLQALTSLADDLRAVPQKKSVIYFQWRDPAHGNRE